MPIIPQKCCPTCSVLKPTTDFSKDRQRADGLAYRCKLCNRARHRDYYDRHREQVIARARQYQHEHPEIRTKAKRTWIARHRAQHLADTQARSARWRAANRDKDRAAAKRWVKANPDAVRTIHHRRRARKANAPGSFTTAEWQAMKARYGYQCLRCHRREPDVRLTIDHVVPLALGGANDITNIQPLCRACNSSKGAREIIDYRT